MADLSLKTPAARLYHTGGPLDGPPLLLIHGFGSDRYSWAATAPAFLARHSVWSVDLPGHGEATDAVGAGDASSMATAILHAMDGTLTTPLSVVGHSLGGAVAVELARQRPALVKHAILVAPAGLGLGLDRDFVTALPELTDPEDAERLLKRLVTNQRLISPQMVQHVSSTLEKPGRREALRKIAGQLLHLRRPAIPDTLDLTVIWGDADSINSPDPAWLADLGTKAHRMAETGHMPQVERARAVNAIIAAAVAGT